MFALGRRAEARRPVSNDSGSGSGWGWGAGSGAGYLAFPFYSHHHPSLIQPEPEPEPAPQPDPEPAILKREKSGREPLQLPAFMRITALLFILIAILLFLPFNLVATRTLVRLHPRRRLWIIVAVVAGNLMWPFFPLLRTFTPYSRAVRAVFGPMWFGWTSFAILYTMLVTLIALARLPFMRRVPFAEFARWPSRAFLWLTIIGSIVGFYQAIVPLRVERVLIAIDGLPAEAEGTRIALLGDLHVGLFTRPSRIETIFATTRDLRPDVILIAGDLIDDDPFFVPKLLAATRALDPHTPLLAVLGNHEMYGSPARVITALRNTRIRLLVNEGLRIGTIWFAGISDYAWQEPGLKPNLGEALAARNTEDFPILVAHQPRSFDEARQWNVPLTLVAHTHGGQCGFRPLRLSLAGVFLPYHMGLYRRGEAQLYVNTGTGYWLLPFRLGMTPEITLIELRAR
jgi:predicted MPP superfamily phosphohydrolase